MKSNEFIVEGLPLKDITWIGNLVPHFIIRSMKVAGKEVVETKKLMPIISKWIATGELTPQEEAFAKEQLMDLAKATAAVMLATGVGNAVAATTGTAGAAQSATAATAALQKGLEHAGIDVGLEALAKILSAKFGINFLQAFLDWLRTKSGEHYDALHHKKGQDELDKEVEKKFQKATTGFGGWSEDLELNEDLRKWFKEKWVRFGPDGKIRGSCARGDDSEGKPKCLPQSKAHALGKKGRKYAASKKRREDPNPERRGPAKNVATKKKSNEGVVEGSGPRVGDEVYYGTRLIGWFKGYSKLGKIITEPNVKEMGDEYLNKDVYWEPQDHITIKPKQGVAEGIGEETDIGKYALHYKVNDYLSLFGKNDGFKTQSDINDAMYTSYILVDLGKELIKLYGNQNDPKFIELKDKWQKLFNNAMNRYQSQQGEEEQLDELKCWPGFTRVRGVPAGAPGSCKKKVKEMHNKKCPHCGGEMVNEELMNEKKDACYYKVKSRYKVWPSAYASGALVKCRKKGAKNWGNKTDEDTVEKGLQLEHLQLHNHKTLLTETVTYKLWESAGKKLVEANLSQEQITQIFKQVEQGATAAGGNRTLIGKGKDAYDAVNRAWEDVKTKIQNSTPIKNVDTMYDNAVAKIEAGLGGPDNVLNKVIQKYRKFAKENPVAQSWIYGMLIAAAGISGAGLGGAAVLALLKMGDKLLQGDKFSSAAYQGAKTGAIAYGVSKLSDYIKGNKSGSEPSGSRSPSSSEYSGDMSDFNKNDAILRGAKTSDGQSLYRVVKGEDGVSYSRFLDDKLAQQWATEQGYDNVQQALQGIKSQTSNFEAVKSITQLKNLRSDATSAGLDAVKSAMANGETSTFALEEIAKGAMEKYSTLTGGKLNPTTIEALAARTVAIAQSQATNENKNLTKNQINFIFEHIEGTIILEGIADLAKKVAGTADKVQGAVAKGIDYVATKGKNLTTKITADKLQQAWKTAGSPTDSEAVKSLLLKNGVSQDVIDSAFAQANVVSQPQQTQQPQTQQPQTPPQQQPQTQQPQTPPQQQPKSGIGQGMAQSNVNPELYKRLASRKAGKPVYAGGLE